jgi:hypothetical protein
MKKAFFTLVIILNIFVFNSNVYAAIEGTDGQRIKEALLMCANVGRYMDRLSCYDNLVEHFKLRETGSGTIEIGSDVGLWKVSKDISPIDDIQTIYMKLAADTRVQLKNGSSIRPTLIIECSIQHVHAYVYFSTFMGPKTNQKAVIERFDRLPPMQLFWDISDDSFAMYHPDDIRFIADMLKANVLHISAMPYKNPKVDVKFVIKGFENAVKEIKDDCGW